MQTITLKMFSYFTFQGGYLFNLQCYSGENRCYYFKKYCSNLPINLVLGKVYLSISMCRAPTAARVLKGLLARGVTFIRLPSDMPHPLSLRNYIILTQKFKRVFFLLKTILSQLLEQVRFYSWRAIVILLEGLRIRTGTSRFGNIGAYFYPFTIDAPRNDTLR